MKFSPKIRKKPNSENQSKNRCTRRSHAYFRIFTSSFMRCKEISRLPLLSCPGIACKKIASRSTDTSIFSNTNVNFTGSVIVPTTARGTGTSAFFMYGLANGTNTFQIYNNGSVRNTSNSYAGISDIKLKENIDKNVIEELLSSLVSATLLNLEIEDLNLVISDKIIAESLKKNKNFQNENGINTKCNFERENFSN